MRSANHVIVIGFLFSLLFASPVHAQQVFYDVQEFLFAAQHDPSLLDEEIILFVGVAVDHEPFLDYVNTAIKPKHEPAWQALSDEVQEKYRLVNEEYRKINTTI